MINQDAFLDTLSTAKPLPQLLSKLPPSLSLNDNITVLISMIPIQASPALHATLHCYPGNTIYQVSTELLPTQVMQKTHVQPLLVYISPDPKSPQAIALLAKSWCHIQVSVQSDSISDSRYPLILRSQLFTIK